MGPLKHHTELTNLVKSALSWENLIESWQVSTILEIFTGWQKLILSWQNEALYLQKKVTSVWPCDYYNVELFR